MKASLLQHILLTAFLVILAPMIATAKPEAELDSMQGSWKVVAAEKGNKTLTDEEIKPLKVVVKKTVLTLSSDDQKLFEARLTLNPSTTPKRLRLEIEGHNAPGIYELAGDQLRLCWDNNGEQPAKFSGINDSGSLIHLKLKRD